MTNRESLLNELPLLPSHSSLLGFGSSSNSYSRAWMNQSLVARSFVALSTHMSSADLEMKLLSFTHFESVLSLSLFSHNYFAHGEIKLIKVRPPKKKCIVKEKSEIKAKFGASVDHLLQFFFLLLWFSLYCSSSSQINYACHTACVRFGLMLLALVVWWRSIHLHQPLADPVSSLSQEMESETHQNFNFSIPTSLQFGQKKA